MRKPARLAFALAFFLFSCTSATAFTGHHRAAVSVPAPTQWNHDWSRGAVFYEIFVRSFSDSNGDGIGDLPGITANLDYLRNLGVDAVWLTPIFASPSYHGYDITDYEQINKDFGSSTDFRNFLTAAHDRGIKVILDLVMNHTSNQHPWFVDSASSTSSAHRDWYVWNATDPGWTQPWGPDPAWHPLNGAFYYGVFWSGMPDLNYRNPEVKAEMFGIARYWLAQGVDGFRLDATRYLVEDGPGAGEADTPETHQLLKEFAANVRTANPQSTLVAENTTDIVNLAKYYGSADVIRGGDEMPSNFNFPLASAIVSGVNQAYARPISGTITADVADYPPGAIDAPFLTNHDQTRLATQLGNDPGKLRDAAAILLTLPGAPFIYYGEEVGLQNGPTSGDESKRTPMPWSASGGFSTATPWFPYAPGIATANVASQANDPQSLLSYYRHWIAARHGSHALMKGDITPLDAGDSVLAFTRDSGDERVLVVHNLSASPMTTKPLALDASATETVYADDSVPSPAGSAGAWTVAMPPHSSGVWRLK